jgi:hypothetical protein
MEIENKIKRIIKNIKKAPEAAARGPRASETEEEYSSQTGGFASYL